MIKFSLSNFAFVFSFLIFFFYNYLFFFNVNLAGKTLYESFVLSVVFLANNLLNSFLIFSYIYFLARRKKLFIILFPILLFLVTFVFGLNITTRFEVNAFLLHDILDNTTALSVGLLKLYKELIIKGFIVYFVILFVSFKIIDFKTKKKIKLKKFTIWLIFIYICSYALFYYTINYTPFYKKNIVRQSNLREEYKNYSQNAFTFTILLDFKPQKQGLNKKRQAFLKQNVIPLYKNLYDKSSFYNKDNAPRLLIVTVGESLNASHISLNGYKRKGDKYFPLTSTTPNLEKLKSKIVSFKKNLSCSTLTSMEWPCMFFPYRHNDFNNFNDIYFLEDNLPTVFTILHNQGYKVFLINFEETLWEQSIRKIRARIQLVSPKDGDTNLYLACSKIKMSNERAECQLQNVVKFIKTHQNKKVAIFTYGAGGDSHYSYEYHDPKHITKKHPNKIQNNVNKYDATILFLDVYLYKLINYLDKNQKNSMMLYISDHGEAVAQGVQHGQSYDLAKTKYKDVLNPATIVWFSNSWQKNVDKNAMRKAKYYRNNLYNHSQLFEGILKCAGIENKNYMYKQNIC